jgi:ArsR family transcriptional regulator
VSNRATVNGKMRKPKRAPTRHEAPGSLPTATLRRLSKVFWLLADENRLKILLALSQEGEMNVKALTERLGQSQPAVSHHLSQMRDVLVSCRRAGKNNYYSVQADFLRDLLEQFFADTDNGQKQFRLKSFVLAYRRR